MKKMSATEIIDFIAQAPKKTPVKVYLKGELTALNWPAEIKTFVGNHSGVVIGDWQIVGPFLKENATKITDYYIENISRNSAVPLLDLKNISARIEPGAIIRDQVSIGANAVVMMGAVVNIGAEIGPGAMIDMNAVLGGRAVIGANSHIGAGAVIAGVVEPASAQPVRIGKNVLIGANAVVLEGVQVGDQAVVAAGAVVTQDVPAKTVVAGVPAKVIKQLDQQTTAKTKIEKDLRKL
ncbi:2,3,4,5-tetrahydropyridine-2,6-dicarboxylate N-acetyltransferase [Bombilactobacillus mellis]|uniref:2,3,4,5-tetrahydropyridine-2,6-dicarboxylate N-acetyltransferase n=1 Tax=Bombilactobacillus mellis TaxID=1218508 RepID=UPI0015809C0C|nr:2,3,4,5-tetrahydropyridine-2,6-dicarboxylate N-acetyltransferase [Bombilactobacillus mellis]NUF25130.1 2,3,4,5-tetrahydropyridine-2,6-dicarboxylate N-acetyltransferase [Bombilactobacillus mellis]NUG66436.1 2,3,4,5-tetrahydropyridine-2,6-dicarboxylate N-acetyltransferase [Bombilactobacillus mellis]